MSDLIDAANALVESHLVHECRSVAEFYSYPSIEVSKEAYLRLGYIASKIGERKFLVLPSGIQDCDNKRCYLKCNDIAFSVPSSTPMTGSKVADILRQLYGEYTSDVFCAFSFKENRTTKNHVDVFLTNINLFSQGEYARPRKLRGIVDLTF
jgi:hypothetical protein